MRTVTLHALTDPDHKIQAIKALRYATGMGLKESLQMCNDIMGKTGVSCASASGVPTSQKVVIYETGDPTMWTDLCSKFIVTEDADVLHSAPGLIPADDVLELIFEALSCMSIDRAEQFRSGIAYQRIRPQLAFHYAPTA